MSMIVFRAGPDLYEFDPRGALGEWKVVGPNLEADRVFASWVDTDVLRLFVEDADAWRITEDEVAGRTVLEFVLRE